MSVHVATTARVDVAGIGSLSRVGDAVVVKALGARQAGDGLDGVPKFVGSSGAVPAAVISVDERLTAVSADVWALEKKGEKFRGDRNLRCVF